MHTVTIWQTLARLPAAAAHVYCCLRAAAAAHGPTLSGGHGQIAAASGLAQRTLQRHLPALVDAGLAEVDVTPGRPARVRVVGADTAAPHDAWRDAVERRLTALEAARAEGAPAVAAAVDLTARVLATLDVERGVDVEDLTWRLDVQAHEVRRVLVALEESDLAHQTRGTWRRSRIT